MAGRSNPRAFPLNVQEDEDEYQHNDESDGSAGSREMFQPGGDKNSEDVNSDGFVDAFADMNVDDRQRSSQYYTGFNASAVGDALSARPPYERNDAVTGRRDDNTGFNDRAVGAAHSDRPPYERNDAVAGRRDEFSSERDGAVTGRHDEFPDAIPDRIDAVSAVPNTILRKNITQRRSHGRPRDRVSLGTSIPIADLISKKPNPRNKDIAYSSEFARETDIAREPSLPSRPDTPPIPDFTRKDMHLASPNPEMNRRFQQLWVQKKEVEEDMKQALELDDEHNYRSLESQLSNINSRMFTLRHAAVIPSKPEASTDPLTWWNYDGSSYIIYLAYKDRLIPWVVWSQMPVALLVQATVSALALSGLAVGPDEILLFHHDAILDPVSGRMSDQPILRDDIVSVYLTARGGCKTRSAQPRDGNTPHPEQDGHERSHQRNQQRHDPRRDHHIPQHRGSSREYDSRLDDRLSHQRTIHRNDSYRDRLNRDQNVSSPSKPTQMMGRRNEMMGRRNDHDDVRSSRSSSVNGDDKGESSNTSRSHDKIKQNFKCPRFSGLTKDWKLWDKGFQRYLSIWDLDYVLQPDFFDEVPFPQSKIKETN